MTEKFCFIHRFSDSSSIREELSSSFVEKKIINEWTFLFSISNCRKRKNSSSFSLWTFWKKKENLFLGRLECRSVKDVPFVRLVALKSPVTTKSLGFTSELVENFVCAAFFFDLIFLLVLDKKNSFKKKCFSSGDATPTSNVRVWPIKNVAFRFVSSSFLFFWV